MPRSSVLLVAAVLVAACQPAAVTPPAIDARTVRFELREGYGPFLAHLAMPPAAISRGAAGTGPFVAGPDAIAPDGTISLRRNETYRLRDAAGTALPYLDALVFRPVGD